jgi:hypothetical protein
MLQPGLKAFFALLPSRTSDDTLKNQWKIVVRQAAAHLSHAVLVAREEVYVEKGWKPPATRPCLQQGAPHYRLDKSNGKLNSSDSSSAI